MFIGAAVRGSDVNVYAADIAGVGVGGAGVRPAIAAAEADPRPAHRFQSKH